MQRTTCAKQLFTIERITHFNAKSFPILDIILNLFSKVSGTNNHLGNVLGFQKG